MTAREVYEAMLIELNKVEAPSMLLEDFNYIFNKAISQYVNKRYNIYDINQQTTDDIRVLKATAILPVTKAFGKYAGSVEDGNSDDGASIEEILASSNALFGATYEAVLPSDYLHILNCVCNFKVNKQYKCYDKGSYIQFSARRLTADLWSQIINNFYMRPIYKRPYYYIHNVNTNENNPTNPYSENSGTDITSVSSEGEVTGGLPKTIKIGEQDINNFNKIGQIRYGNSSPVRLEIRYGKDDSLFTLKSIYIDYLKTPQHIRLTQEQLDLTEDTSQIMEFPDYVCQEIINELVKLMLENSSDPRLQTNLAVNQTIANPVQQQSQPTNKKNN